MIMPRKKMQQLSGSCSGRDGDCGPASIADGAPLLLLLGVMTLIITQLHWSLAKTLDMKRSSMESSGVSIHSCTARTSKLKPKSNMGLYGSIMQYTNALLRREKVIAHSGEVLN